MDYSIRLTDWQLSNLIDAMGIAIEVNRERRQHGLAAMREEVRTIILTQKRAQDFIATERDCRKREYHP
jgi:hypothetical protein